jgi:hypothetical protein
MIKVEMHFLPDIYVPCDVCHGQRYNRETLEVAVQGQEHPRDPADDRGGSLRILRRRARGASASCKP